MNKTLHTVQVDLSGANIDRSYPIVIGRALLQDAPAFQALLGDRGVIMVTNETVGPLYLPGVRRALGSSRKITTVVLPDGEQHKTLLSLTAIIDAALSDRHERSAVMLALGGGVIGDMTGFAAACLLRGIDFVQLPTTLLSQVDSSVGGKTGINHAMGKNLVGAFHQPIAVWIDLDTLTTLPSREYAAGLAEVVKYGLIHDRGFFDWLEDNSAALKDRDETAVAYAIERSCAIKAEVVSADECEGGIRAILNFGHTFGHAIERVQGYGNWLHGEAVACGMLIASRVSAMRGCLTRDDVARIEGLLDLFSLPTRPPVDMGADDFIEAMASDKKVSSGRIRYILLHEMGRAEIVDDVTREEIVQALC